jgi:hypothetical protein
VPANRKWYRNLAIADALVGTLSDHRKAWSAYLKELSEQRISELADLRTMAQQEPEATLRAL